MSATDFEDCRELVRQLDRVREPFCGAKQEWRIKYTYNGQMWHVVVEEAEEGHIFVEGRGPNPDYAADIAQSSVEEAATEWGWICEPDWRDQT